MPGCWSLVENRQQLSQKRSKQIKSSSIVIVLSYLIPETDLTSIAANFETVIVLDATLILLKKFISHIKLVISIQIDMLRTV